jgi:glutamate N-acetyltransferase/amino-acid N-acetyltransferase
MTTIPGGVTAAKGFQAAGVHCGVRRNKNKRDIALIVGDGPCAAAAVFTRNLVKAAPIQYCMERLPGGYGTARAILINSGNANACAPNGMRNAGRMAEACAKHFGIPEDQVLVASTGVIGQELPVGVIIGGIPLLATVLSPDGSETAAEGIMTTDLRKKSIAVRGTVGGAKVTVGGIAKGSGMIQPNMGTMLAFITTDAVIAPAALHAALYEVTQRTFNRVCVDGDTSTNDMCAVLASGLAGNTGILPGTEEYQSFTALLEAVCLHLAREVARDGEGATKLIECRVGGAASEGDAETLGMSVIRSSLVKSMVFGCDANIGRVLCAMGYSGAPFRVGDVTIRFTSGAGSVEVCRGGLGLAFDEALAKAVLSQEEITIEITAGTGPGSAATYGCDLTYEYVRINGDYRS